MFENLYKILIKYFPLFMEGMGVTLLLSLITVVFGTILGTVFALMRLSKSKILNIISETYTEIVRGIPLLLQLWVIYLLFSSALGKVGAVCLALLLNSAAYVAEIIRSGIQAVDKGQVEASRSLGINANKTMTKIVLPQAVKNILPALGNEFVTVIKETSLSSVFYIGDLMTAKTIITTQTYLAIEPYIIIGIIYFILTYTLSKFIGKFEKRLKLSD
ncbi:MAG TPA: amino acid ABC transporter permease [Bacilli bacterium]|mgnify:CR=1 FL=1|jgi:His/Glu/Gln/Arg/opine family amino acid ABC transporter permease subunit|nr:amino acid ABC transporter permease [Bacilli bacterium]NLT01838.1 amino acid ABC transporter permease [Acholeplasmataceae bacterium]HNZ77320.1 amino acid ABC transporter permease [Bacilli bacterium]HOD60663.1 amino acid ABC transporter permease [Bacilli bacterium]HOE06287.1 amino acid ABC transporter permease [Bacilli bacterium]